MKRKLLTAMFGLFFAGFGTLCALEGRIFDRTGTLSEGDITELDNRIARIQAKYNFDLIIVFDRSLSGGNIDQKAMSFYEAGGYGAGPADDGAIFYNAVEDREFTLLASGRGQGIFNSAAYNKTAAGVESALKKNNLKGAAKSFLDDWEKYLELDARGKRFSSFQVYKIPVIAGGWVIALLIALFTVMAWKAGMNTAIPPGQAAAYIAPGSLAMTERGDKFLYSTVKKTEKAKAQSPAVVGGGAGRSPQKTSASGRTYSGGGRKY